MKEEGELDTDDEKTVEEMEYDPHIGKLRVDSFKVLPRK